MDRAPAWQPVADAGLARPRLELSGPKLARAFETLVTGAEAHGGVERCVAALRFKAERFREALGAVEALEPETLGALLACLATVRRRARGYLVASRFGALRLAIARLLAGRGDTSTTDERVQAFCGAFPDDREHRWVRDLAAELLHNVDPERYPPMCRWVWDARAGTGVLREIWHAPDPARARIDVADNYATFVVLREELAQYLSASGVFRDIVHYVDLLLAQVYAGYIGEQGGAYLRTDFTTPEDPLLHVRRLLGIDGGGADRRCDAPHGRAAAGRID